MAVRTKQLGGTVSIGTADTAVYTVPSGETTIVKHCVLYNRHATLPVTITINRGTTSSPGDDDVFIRETLEPRTVLRLDLWMVLRETNAITAEASIAAAGSCYFSGTELEGVAD